jgi:hypothetical protein
MRTIHIRITKPILALLPPLRIPSEMGFTAFPGSAEAESHRRRGGEFALAR